MVLFLQIHGVFRLLNEHNYSGLYVLLTWPGFYPDTLGLGKSWGLGAA